jgi:hypothetical protein
VVIVEQELLFQLLPEDGTSIHRDALATELSLRLQRELAATEFDRFIWQLASRVVWDPHQKKLCRSTSNVPPSSDITCEQDLEPWFERYLFRQAAEDFFEPRAPSFNVVVQNTARTNRNEGRFTKPDICMACVSRYHYTPGTRFDLFCFELKLGEGFNIPAVMQALANSAYCHFTYMAVYLPEGATTPRYVSAIRTRAVQHGVGIVRISDHLRDDGYQVILPGRRHEPRPGDTEAFIESRFDEANRNALRNWVRT